MNDAIDPHLDPELLPLLAGFPDIPLNAQTLTGFRAAIAQMSVLPDPASHPDVTIEVISVTGPAGAPPVRCLLYKPARGVGGAPADGSRAGVDREGRGTGGGRVAGTASPVGGSPRVVPTMGALLHIHGGGFVMGLPEMDVSRNLMLVAQLGCVILSVDYRLAPEHPHPAAVEDCYAALVWLAQHSEALGFASGRLGVIGESAGAGLSHWVALLARDRGAVALACVALIYPMLVPCGEEIGATSQDARIGRYVWPPDSNEFAWASLLGGGPHDRGRHNRAELSGLGDDLSRLPPAFVAAAELDLFVHDNLDLASRLMRSGNRVETHCYPGAFHGFDRMADASVARRFTRDLLDFLRRYLS